VVVQTEETTTFVGVLQLCAFAVSVPDNPPVTNHLAAFADSFGKLFA